MIPSKRGKNYQEILLLEKRRFEDNEPTLS